MFSSVSVRALRDEVNGAMKSYNVVHNNYSVTGKDLLLGSVLIRLVRKIIQRDIREAPFTMVGVEQFLEGRMEIDGRKIAIGGTVDRIDSLVIKGKRVTRIIDYKTGRVDMLPRTRNVTENVDEYFTSYFDGGKYKSGFQAYYYAALYKQIHPDEDIKAGIYELKKVSKGTEFLRRGEILDPELLSSFRERLYKLIHELFDPDIPFRQTDDLSKCRYCAYKTICQRND